MNTSYNEILDLFPHIPQQDVQQALLRNNNDFERTVDFLLTNCFDLDLDINVPATHSKDTQDTIEFKLSELRTILPHVSIQQAQKALSNCDDDLIRTVQYLIDDNTQSPTSNKTLHNIQTKVERIAMITDISEQDAAVYFNKNQKHIVDALVDIVLTYRPVKGSDADSDTADRAGIPKGGRVQSSQYRANSAPSTSSSSSSSLPYTYNDTNDEVKELGDIIASDKVLVNISWSFCIHALKFFQGDVSKVLTLLFYIIEQDGIKKTYKDPPLDYTAALPPSSASPTPSFHSIDFSKVSRKKKRPPTSQLVSVSSCDNKRESILDSHQLSLQKLQLSWAKSHNRIDLHHFVVENAKITCLKALEDWWNDELKAREDVGKSQTGEVARLVEPFLIVTGRGIHSDGGVSKVRVAINALLRRSPYIYDEDVGTFTVKGKRKI